jgi:hypothetical protein
MGHTHYWGWGAFVNEQDYKNALKDCRKIIRNSPVPLAGGDGTGKPKLRNGFQFNGAGDEMSEDLRMPLEPDRDAWPFCKTNQREYDSVVVACLIAMQDRLGRNAFELTSDGDAHEWEDGKRLAEIVLKRELKIPQGVIDNLRHYGWYARVYRTQHPEYEYTSLDVTHPDRHNERVPEYAKE